MRKYIMPIVAVVVVVGLATPAMADDSGRLISMQAALDVATDLGLMTVSHTEFQGDQWQVEGRDTSGRYLEVYVDAATGDVRHVNRGW
jgi:peptidase YpeB-like protein